MEKPSFALSYLFFSLITPHWIMTFVCRGAPNSIFDFKVQDATGGEVDLSSYKDTKKAFLIVNVASK